MDFAPILPPAAPAPRGRAPWLQDPGFLRSDERELPYPEVFVGPDGDVVRLLSAFQTFLDECRDDVDRRGFAPRSHPPQVTRDQQRTRTAQATDGCGD